MLREHDASFTGLLYAGLMLTKSGPRVVEFNCRFGDPETQAVLPLMESNLLELMSRAIEPAGLDGAPTPLFRAGFAVTTVVSAPGYPDAPRTGAPIELPELEEGVILFQAGTRRAPDGSLVTAGGRVVSVTAVAEHLEDAQRRSAAGADGVSFPGRHYRPDIGWRETRRHAGAA
jgi:phosphoribosylamine--glycine ligase